MFRKLENSGSEETTMTESLGEALKLRRKIEESVRIDEAAGKVGSDTKETAAFIAAAGKAEKFVSAVQHVVFGSGVGEG